MNDIMGNDGELVERLIALVDRDPKENPNWWYDNGFFLAVIVGSPVRRPEETDRPQFISELRGQIGRLISAGLDEAFLVRSLRVVLDDYNEEAADISKLTEQVESMDTFTATLLADEEALRNVWETKMRSTGITLEDFRARLESPRGNPLRRELEPERVAERWERKELWLRAKSEQLSDKSIERWQVLRGRRAR